MELNEILKGLEEQRKVLDNLIDNLTCEECCKLYIYEQHAAITEAESSMRKLFKIKELARKEHPEMFTDKVPQPLVIQ